MEHIHGLGTNPADGKLYVATHHGVFRVADRSATPVGPRQDTMGFTVVGPNRFLGSGHPGQAGQADPLGLIESRDGAQTWRSTGFSERVDFHALDIAGGRIVGYSADRGELFAGLSPASLTSLGRYSLFDVAADPSDANRMLLTSSQGRLLRHVVGVEPAPVRDAPLMGPIDFATDDIVVGLGGGGEVYVSPDSGTTWRMVKDLRGTSEALVAEADQWFVATTEAIFRSTDQGRTWARYFALSS